MSEKTPQPRSYAPEGTATGTGPSARGARPIRGSAPVTATPRPRKATGGEASPFPPALNTVPDGAARPGDDQRLSGAGLTGSSIAAGPRRVRLAISRVDPWSVMKLAFLLSIAIGIMTVVSTAVLWFVLDGMHVFSSVNKTVTEVVGTESVINILKYVEFGRVVSLAVLIAVINVVLLTALTTIGAFLYNIVAALVGGIHLTLTDE
jgi:hypothetical protein